MPLIEKQKHAGIASAIFAFGSSTALASLFAAEHLRIGFIEITDKDCSYSIPVWGILVLVLIITGLLASYMALHFSEFGVGIPLWKRWTGENAIGVVHLWTIICLFVLPGLIWLTGGPARSWFTSFLLVVVPLAGLLGVERRHLLRYFFFLLFPMYVITIAFHVFLPSEIKWYANTSERVVPHELSYEIVDAIFVLLAAGFLTLVEIARPKREQTMSNETPETTQPEQPADKPADLETHDPARDG